MFCPSCGSENEDGSKFCQSCGADMLEDSGYSGAQEQAPPPPSDSYGAPPPPPPPPSAHKPPPSGGSTEVDIGGWISKSFTEVFSDVMNYILLALVVSVVSSVTIGILAGPLLAGSLIVIRRKLRGEGAIEIGAVFNEGFKYFLPTFLLVLLSGIGVGIVVGILQLIPVIGQILGILIIAYWYPFLAFGCHFITEEGADFGNAFSKSFEAMNSNVMMLSLFGLLAAIIASAGSIACGIGVLVTVPAAMVMMALMLESFYPRR